MTVRQLIGVIAAAIAATRCGASPMPAAPSSSPPVVPAAASQDLSGMWSGSANDSQGATSVSWVLMQSGANVSGTVRTSAVNPDDGSCSSCHRNKSGTVTGTLSGSSLTLTMFFAAGGDGDPTPACSATLTVSSTSVSTTQVASTYSGSDTCEGAFANGTMTMHQSQVASRKSQVASH
jgi:hypothetical protein